MVLFKGTPLAVLPVLFLLPNPGEDAVEVKMKQMHRANFMVPEPPSKWFKVRPTLETALARELCGLMPFGTECYSKERAPEKGKQPVDEYGDPLPKGAIARLGTVRFRHHAVIRGLAVSPDRTVVASWGEGNNPLDAFPPGVISLWDARTGKEVRRFSELNYLPRQVAFSPDGTMLGATGEELFILWHISGRQLHFRQGVFSFSFSPDSKSLALSDADGALRIVDASSGRLTASLVAANGGKKSENTWYSHPTFSPDAKILARGEPEGKVLFWNPVTGEQIGAVQLSCKDMPVRLTFAPDGQVLALFTRNHLRLVSCLKWKEDFAVSVRSVPPDWIAFSPNGKDIISETFGKVCWWDRASGKEVQAIDGKAVGISFDRKVMAIRRHHDILCLDIEKRAILRTFPAKAFAPASYKWANLCYGGLSEDTTSLITTELNAIRVLKTQNGDDAHGFAGHFGPISLVRFAASHEDLIIVGDGTATFWNMRSYKKWRSITLDDLPFVASSISRDAKTVAVGSFQKTGVQVWDLYGGKKRKWLETQDNLPQFALSPEGTNLIVAGHMRGNDLHVINLVSGAKVELPAFRMFPPFALAFLPHRGLVAATSNSDLTLWEVASGKKLGVLQEVGGLGAESFPLTFSPDGRFVAVYKVPPGATGSTPKSVDLVELASGRTALRLLGHQGAVRAFAFSPNGRILATGAGDGIVRLWEISSGRLLAQFSGHSGLVRSLGFADNGRWLASGGSDTTALVWDVSAFTGLSPPVSELDESHLASLCAKLSQEDTPQAFAVLWKLVCSPESTSAYLAKNWRQFVGTARIHLLITQLGDNDFHKREQAARQLERYGREAEILLREVSAKPPSEEVRARVSKLLGKLGSPQGWLTPQETANVRLIQVLEYIGTREAFKLLVAIGEEEPTSHLGKEARMSLKLRAP